MVDEITFIESMKILEYKPGDIIVLKTETKLSLQHVQRLRHAVEEIIMPQEKGVQVMILEEGMDIGVLRGEQCK